MSQADDILFSPIATITTSTTGVDILTRPCAQHKGYTYDWKPVTDRAKNWFQKHFSWVKAHNGVDADGWYLNHAETADRWLDSQGTNFKQELIDGNFIFETVP